MRSKLTLAIWFGFIACAQPDDMQEADLTEYRTLGDRRNKGLDEEGFYQVHEKLVEKEGIAILFVLPSSSCFNCFEDLIEYLKTFYGEAEVDRIVVVRNDKIKEREIKFSLQGVLPSSNVKIVNRAC